MTNYQLMSILEKLPAGATIKFRALRTLDELPVYNEDDDLREIEDEVNNVDECGGNIILSD